MAESWSSHGSRNRTTELRRKQRLWYQALYARDLVIKIEPIKQKIGPIKQRNLAWPEHTLQTEKGPKFFFSIIRNYEMAS